MNRWILFVEKRLGTGNIVLLVASIALAVVFASCSAQQAGTGSTNKPDPHTQNGKIAVSRLDNRDGQSDIYVMKSDGTGLKSLAAKPVGDSPNPSPAFSPVRR